MYKYPRLAETRYSAPRNGRRRPPAALVPGNASTVVRIAAGRRSLRVLIVDDDRDIADSLSRLITSWGHDVRRAYDGASGLRLAVAYEPEVVLLDISMSGMDGYELAKQLCLVTRLKGCFLVAMRGHADAQQGFHCKEAEIDLVLAKPVDLVVLQTLLLMEGERLGPAWSHYRRN
jgi:CheY-like chemotaxis protein